MLTFLYLVDLKKTTECVCQYYTKNSFLDSTFIMLDLNYVDFHYDAEVYPNPHRQICAMRVSRVRFYYVNTLKMEQNCGK